MYYLYYVCSKVLGLFNLIQFSNSRCNSTDSDKQGVCYTATECRERGGNAKGNCASGFGVCCLCKYYILSIFNADNLSKI